MQTNFDVIVIGGGPAGCAAATFIARSKWSALIIDSSISEGFLGSIGNVGYFPGFPESIGGLELLRKMRKQTELEGAKLVIDTVLAISGAAGSYKLATESGREFTSRLIVVATGAAGRTNYLQGEREFLGRGVSYDVLADGPAVAKRTAAIIGKTREAAEAACALARFADRIHFIIPSSKIEAPDELVNSLKDNSAIDLHFSASLKKINGTEHVNSITVFSGGQEKEIPVVGVFTFIHEYKVTTAFLDNVVDLSPAGAIKVDRKLATSAGGIFAAGDVLCGKPQLPAIAASQGLLAGIKVGEELSTK